MIPLADAAVCRSESDWLVGINGTRAMTAFNSKTGGFHLTTVGRVQTPTLAILVEREEKIKKFVSRDYWEVHGTFAAKAGNIPAAGSMRSLSARRTDEHLRPERLWDRARAQALHDQCLGKPGIVTEESKPTTSLSPLLYDLTSLQREANGRFGFSAKNTWVWRRPSTKNTRCSPTPAPTPGAAGGLPRDGQEDFGHVGRHPLQRVCRPDIEGRLGAAQQAHLQQRQNLGPLCDHPHAGGSQTFERAGTEALRPGHQAVPGDLLSRRRISGDHAHHPRRGRAVQERGQGHAQCRLAGGLWQGGEVGGHAQPRAGAAQEVGARP